MLYKRPAKRKKNWRLRLLGTVTALCLVACLFGTMGFTFLWFTSRDDVTNRFAAAQPVFSVQAVDVYVKSDVPPQPGNELDKRVGAVNNGTLPAFTRLMLLPVFTKPGEGGAPALMPAVIGRHIHLDIDTAHWKDGGDGYYYYLGALAAGSSTDDLFTKVKIAGDIPPEYHGAALDIEVKCESVATNRWDYRQTWWGGTGEPVKAEWLEIDRILRDAATD